MQVPLGKTRHTLAHMSYYYDLFIYHSCMNGRICIYQANFIVNSYKRRSLILVFFFFAEKLMMARWLGYDLEFRLERGWWQSKSILQH